MWAVPAPALLIAWLCRFRRHMADFAMLLHNKNMACGTTPGPVEKTVGMLEREAVQYLCGWSFPCIQCAANVGRGSRIVKVAPVPVRQNKAQVKKLIAKVRL